MASGVKEFFLEACHDVVRSFNLSSPWREGVTPEVQSTASAAFSGRFRFFSSYFSVWRSNVFSAGRRRRRAVFILVFFFRVSFLFHDFRRVSTRVSTYSKAVGHYPYKK